MQPCSLLTLHIATSSFSYLKFLHDSIAQDEIQAYWFIKLALYDWPLVTSLLVYFPAQAFLSATKPQCSQILAQMKFFHTWYFICSKCSSLLFLFLNFPQVVQDLTQISPSGILPQPSVWLYIPFLRSSDAGWGVCQTTVLTQLMYFYVSHQFLKDCDLPNPHFLKCADIHPWADLSWGGHQRVLTYAWMGGA